MHRILKYCMQIPQQLIILSFFIILIGSCAWSVPTTPDDFVPRPIFSAVNNQRIEGSVNVQARIPQTAIRSDDEDKRNWRLHLIFFYYLDETKLKNALEKTIAQNGIFSKISQGNADYVLDVWVESVSINRGLSGKGYIFDMISIWRLTRTKDGKVIVCDFVKSQGVSQAGFRGAWSELNVATREMIQRGTAILLDKSESHLSAMSKAGLRYSMGPVIPGGYTHTEWADHVIQNWSKLKMGMTINEVENVIGTILTSGGKPKENWATERYITDIYTLIFINGKMSYWKLKDSSVKNKAANPISKNSATVKTSEVFPDDEKIPEKVETKKGEVTKQAQTDVIDKKPSSEITKPDVPPSSNLGTPSNNSNLSENGQKLRELKKLRDEGLLTDNEYEQKRKAIVDGM